MKHDNIICFSENANYIKDLLETSGIKSKGYGILPKYSMLDTDLSIQAKGIYAYFCSYTGSGNSVFPSRDRILSDLMVSKDMYYSHFNLLVDQGYVSVKQMQSGKFMKNIYTIEEKPVKFYLPESDKNESASRIMLEGLDSLGYGMIPKILMIDDRLDIKAKAIYAYFCVFSGSGQYSHPQVSTTIHHLGISIPTYYKHFNMLIKLNYITAVQRHDYGRMSINDYCLMGNPIAEDLPRPKNQDTGKISKLTLSSPYAKKQDTEKQDTEKQDTEKQDTENQDNNINSFNINNFNINGSNINPSIMQQASALPVDNSAAPVPIDGLMERDKETVVINEILKEKTLPYWYTADYERVKVAIQYITDYRLRVDGYDENADESNALAHNTFVLFTNALIEMLTAKELIRLKGALISYAKVFDRLNEFIKYEEIGDGYLTIRMDGLVETATTDFIMACGKKKIQNHLQYMKSCIWNAMQVGNIREQALLRYHFN